MNDLPDRDLSSLLAGLRTPPPDDGFEERLQKSLEEVAREPARVTRAARPRRRLLGRTAAVVFAVSAAAAAAAGVAGLREVLSQRSAPAAVSAHADPAPPKAVHTPRVVSKPAVTASEQAPSAESAPVEEASNRAAPTVSAPAVTPNRAPMRLELSPHDTERATPAAPVRPPTDVSAAQEPRIPQRPNLQRLDVSQSSGAAGRLPPPPAASLGPNERGHLTPPQYPTRDGVTVDRRSRDFGGDGSRRPPPPPSDRPNRFDQGRPPR